MTTSPNAQKLNWLLAFFSRHQHLFNNDIVLEGDITLDYQVLIEDYALQNVWPEIEDDFYNFPSNSLAVLSLAMHEVLSILNVTINSFLFTKIIFR